MAEIIHWHRPTEYGSTGHNISKASSQVSVYYPRNLRTYQTERLLGKTINKEFKIINFEARPQDGAKKGQEQDPSTSQRPGGVGHDHFQISILLMHGTTIKRATFTAKGGDDLLPFLPTLNQHFASVVEGTQHTRPVVPPGCDIENTLIHRTVKINAIQSEV